MIRPTRSGLLTQYFCHDWGCEIAWSVTKGCWRIQCLLFTIHACTDPSNQKSVGFPIDIWCFDQDERGLGWRRSVGLALDVGKYIVVAQCYLFKYSHGAPFQYTIRHHRRQKECPVDLADRDRDRLAILRVKCCHDLYNNSTNDIMPTRYPVWLAFTSFIVR